MRQISGRYIAKTKQKAAPTTLRNSKHIIRAAGVYGSMGSRSLVTSLEERGAVAACVAALCPDGLPLSSEPTARAVDHVPNTGTVPVSRHRARRSCGY